MAVWKTWEGGEQKWKPENRVRKLLSWWDFMDRALSHAHMLEEPPPLSHALIRYEGVRGAEEDYFQQIKFFKIKVKAVLFSFAGTATCKVRGGKKILRTLFQFLYKPVMDTLCVQKAYKAPGQRWIRHSPCSRCSLEGEIASDRLYRSVMWLKLIDIYKVFSTCQALFYFIYLYCWEYTRHYFKHSALSSSVLRRRWTGCRAQRQKDGSPSSYISALCSNSFPSAFSSLQLWQFFGVLFFSNIHNNFYTVFLLILFMHLNILCMVTLHSVSDKPNIWNAWGAKSVVGFLYWCFNSWWLFPCGSGNFYCGNFFHWLHFISGKPQDPDLGCSPFEKKL